MLQDGLEAWHYGGRDAASPSSEPSLSESEGDSRQDKKARRLSMFVCPSDSLPASPEGTPRSQERTPRSGQASPRQERAQVVSRKTPGLALRGWGDGASWTEDDSDIPDFEDTREPHHSGPPVTASPPDEPPSRDPGPTPSCWADRATPPWVAEMTSGQAALSPAAAYLQIPTTPLPEAAASEEAPAKQSPEAPGKPPSPPPARRRRRCNPLLLVVKCPTCFALLWLLIVGAVVGLGMVFLPFQLDTSFDSFHKADANASLVHDAFAAALGGIAEQPGRKLQDVEIRLYRQFDLSVAYELKDDLVAEGMFEHRILRAIASFEQSLRELPAWKDLCDMVEPRHKSMCDPGISFVSYTLPSMNVTAGDVVPSSFTPDGRGREIMPLDAVRYITRHRGLEELFLPKHYTFSAHQGPAYLRSSWRFKVPCCTANDPPSLKKAAKEEMARKWKHLTADVLLDALQQAFPEETDPIRVWWEGTDIKPLEVMQVLWEDLRLSAGSVLFVLLYLAIHTRSPLLTCAAFLLIPLSLPVSYVAFALITGSRLVGIINFLSAFIVIGLGADVIFVYSDMWRDSAMHQDTDAGRLMWTYSHAGKATLATSGTTALAFLANLASVLRPLREFGLFMGICVTSAWALISLIFVPLCLTDERLAVRGGVQTLGQSKAERKIAILFGDWAERLSVLRLPCCLLPLLLAVVFCVLGFVFAAPSMGMPELFPADHNQNRGVHVFGEFSSGDQALPVMFRSPPDRESVCGSGDFGADRGCAIHWCEAAAAGAEAGGRNCTCFRRPATCSGGAERAVTMRLAGADVEPGPALYSSALAYVRAGGASPLVSDVWAGAGPSLLMEDWEAGSSTFVPVTEVWVPVLPPSCGWDDQCYCGISACASASLWQRQAAPLRLPEPPAPARRLAAEWAVPASRRAVIEVVYGLDLDADPPLFGQPNMTDSWHFKPGVDFRQPWAQRDMYNMCTDLPSELRVVRTLCWIVDFRAYLRNNYPAERFPLPASRFDMFLAEFASRGITGYGLSKHFLWIRDGSLKACYMSFQVDVDRHAGMEAALDYQEKWDRHLDRANLLASEHTHGAFHVSSLWATTEAHRALVSSTALSLSITLILACFTMLVFTGSCRLSVLVVVSTLQVISGLFFFMVVVVRWTIGPIEVLALIVFVGYALDYSLHVAQKYGRKEAFQPVADGDPPPQNPQLEERLQRVTHALKSIGGANLGSAITTTGCALFLIFCQLTIFKKLGIVVVIVTVLSIAVALAALPGMLLVVGPLHLGRRRCPSRRKLRSGAVRARHLASHPDEIPAACLSLFRSPPPVEASMKEELSACGESKGQALAGKSLWHRQRLGLEACFEGEELSMGMQSARISIDPILEVARPGQAPLGERPMALVDSRPTAVDALKYSA